MKQVVNFNSSKSSFKVTFQELQGLLQGPPGDDYVLTDDDIKEIADIVADKYRYVSAPEYASVGKILKVSDVDAEGRPIAWEPAHMPGVLFEHHCDYITGSYDGTSVGGNNYPDLFIGDCMVSEDIPEGQIWAYGVPGANGNAFMDMKFTPNGKAFKAEIDMQVQSLISPASAAMYRGIIMEFNVPGYPALYFAINADASGDKYLRVSTTKRGSQGVSKQITLNPEAFQRWEILFTKDGNARFDIDGETILTVDGITATDSVDYSRMVIKNAVYDCTSGSMDNLVAFDNIRIVDVFTEEDPTVPEWAKQPEKPAYTADEVGAVPSPVSASVGQMIIVKEVDASGKPIAWEAAHVPGVLVDYDCNSLADYQVEVVGNSSEVAYWSDHVLPAYKGSIVAKTTHIISPDTQAAYADLRIPLVPSGKAVEMTFQMKMDHLLVPSRNDMWRGLIFEYTVPGSPILYFAINGSKDDSNAWYLGVSGSARGTAAKTTKVRRETPPITLTVKYDGVSKAVFYVDGSEILVVDNITVPNTKTEPMLQIRNCFGDYKDSYNEVYFKHIKIVDDPVPGIVREVISAIPVGDEVAY